MPDEADFDIVLHPSGTIGLSGIIDVTAVEGINSAAAAADAVGAPLLFDMSQVSFIDSSAMGAFGRLAVAGLPVTFRNTPPFVRQTLVISGLAAYMRFAGT